MSTGGMERNPFMKWDPKVVQLHYQFEKDGPTVMVDHAIVMDGKEYDRWVLRATNNHKLPDGAVWLVCTEESKYFVNMDDPTEGISRHVSATNGEDVDNGTSETPSAPGNAKEMENQHVKE